MPWAGIMAPMYLSLTLLNIFKDQRRGRTQSMTFWFRTTISYPTAKDNVGRFGFTYRAHRVNLFDSR